MSTATTAALKIFLVACEESADRLGASLMSALRAKAGCPIQFSGVGGDAMAEQGLQSLFPIGDMAIMGFNALLHRLPMMIRRGAETVSAAVVERPDALVIIDSPDFTHRVAVRVRARDPSIPILDYVSPSVWAWRSGRAKTMRRYIDHVLALLPFEPEAHARLGGPPCTYVGHPLIEMVNSLRPNELEKIRRSATPPTVVVLPGSRPIEVKRHIDHFGAAIRLLDERCGPLEVVVPTLPGLFARLKEATAIWPKHPRIVVDAAEKWAAFRTARVALAASGTVTLELALAGVPTVVAYRVSLVEEFVARGMVQVPSVVLANLVLHENVIPELLQRAATPERLAAALVPLLDDTPERRRQTEAFARLDSVMDIGGLSPSAKAAAVVIDVARRGRAHLRREIGT